MPGKVNPVICESLIMVCCQVVGNDAAATLGGLGGVGSLLELNVAMPMMAANVLDSIHLLARGCTMFTDKLLAGLKVDDRQFALMSRMAPKDPTAGGNPVPLDEATCRRLYERALVSQSPEEARELYAELVKEEARLRELELAREGVWRQRGHLGAKDASARRREAV